MQHTAHMKAARVAHTEHRTSTTEHTQHRQAAPSPGLLLLLAGHFGSCLAKNNTRTHSYRKAMGTERGRAPTAPDTAVHVSKDLAGLDIYTLAALDAAAACCVPDCADSGVPTTTAPHDSATVPDVDDCGGGGGSGGGSCGDAEPGLLRQELAVVRVVGKPARASFASGGFGQLFASSTPGYVIKQVDLAKVVFEASGVPREAAALLKLAFSP